MISSVRFRFRKQNFDRLVWFSSGRTVKHCFGRSLHFCDQCSHGFNLKCFIKFRWHDEKFTDRIPSPHTYQTYLSDQDVQLHWHWKSLKRLLFFLQERHDFELPKKVGLKIPWNICVVLSSLTYFLIWWDLQYHATFYRNAQGAKYRLSEGRVFFFFYLALRERNI